MQGLMMEYELTIPAILRRAARVYPEKEIVSRMDNGSLLRINYGALYGRVLRLMNALHALGVRPGDRVATFAWNSQFHLELYFAVPGMGAILHTVNPRLYPDQIRFIIQHAEDRVIFADRSLVGILAGLQPSLPEVRQYVILPDESVMPVEMPVGALHYEDLIAFGAESEAFPEPDERAAAGLCYTSGTTGDPKGVLYSHRSTYLHAMGACMVDSVGISERETVLPVVPMFHANAWGIPYACALTGAKQVFSGAHVLGGPLLELIQAEQVTLSAGVPTVWQILYQYARQHGYDLSPLRTIYCGGAASPPSLVEAYVRDFGIDFHPAWGMTEMSPIGSVSHLRESMADWSPEAKSTVRFKAGISVPGVELDIRDEEGRPLPHDGAHPGELVTRGPWIASEYFKEGKGDSWTADGWFRTGDIATLDRWGFMDITDRRKDMIKNRGEWISSIDMENAALHHADVREAAVVGRPDRSRGEAPVLFLVLADPERQEAVIGEALALLSEHFANWQLPKRSDVHCVASLPKTGVGKMDKKALRAGLSKIPMDGHGG